MFVFFTTLRSSASAHLVAKGVRDSKEFLSSLLMLWFSQKLNLSYMFFMNLGKRNGQAWHP
jgi:hypothetical protein